MIRKILTSLENGDQKYHIHKEIDNLIRRAESASGKSRYTYRRDPQLKRFLRIPQQKKDLFWSEFKRQTVQSARTKYDSCQQKQGKTKEKSIRRCKSTFYIKMLNEEGVFNRPKKQKEVKQKVETKEAQLTERLESRKSRRTFVEQYILKEPQITISPEHSQSNSDLYLEAKRNIGKRRSVVSQERLRLIKS